jgi:hypothetical protein
MDTSAPTLHMFVNRAQIVRFGHGSATVPTTANAIQADLARSVCVDAAIIRDASMSTAACDCSRR